MDTKQELKFRKQQLKESIKLMSLVPANNIILLEKFSKFHNSINNKIYELKEKIKNESKN